MRLYRLFLFAALSLPFTAFGQWLQNPFLHEMDSSENQSRSLMAGYSFKLGSTALTNRFINDYLFTSFIETEVKNTVIPKLRDGNYFGGYTERQLLYTWTGKKELKSSKTKPRYYVGLKARTQYGCFFRPDIYTLMMYGNKNFAGKTAVGDGTSYSRQVYQTLQGGVILERSLKGGPGRRLVYGGGLGIVKGGTLFDVKAEEASLYTSPIGDSLFIHARADASYSEQNKKWSYISGMGLSGNFFVQYPVSVKSTLSMAVTDLGFISYFKNKSTKFHADESLSFTGYEVQSVSFDKGFSGSTFILDSLEKRADSLETHEGFSRSLPTQLQGSFRVQVTKKWQVEAGAEYIMAANSRVQLYGLGRFRASDRFTVAGGVQALGYGNIGMLLTADAVLFEMLRVKVGTENLEALFNADKTTGETAFLQVQARF